jgi:transposase
MAGLPTGIRPLYDDLQPLQPLEPARHLVRDVRGLDRLDRHHRYGGHRQLIHQDAPFGSGRKRGTFKQAIGRSRGGWTTKIHALTDAEGRPRVLLLSPGNVNDIALAPALLATAGPIKRLIADKAYDANSLRQMLADLGAKAVIPSTTSRSQPIPYNKTIYRQRNLIERMFARIKDFRRVATRYDKLARNFLAGALIVAAVIWWLN